MYFVHGMCKGLSEKGIIGFMLQREGKGITTKAYFWIAAYGGTESVLGIIPAQVKHWHWARKDSWFSHIVVEEPGTETSNEWCEPVSEEEYQKLGIQFDKYPLGVYTLDAFRKE